MRRLILLGLLTLAALPAQVSKTAATLNPVNPARGMRIARGTFTGLERRFDGALSNLGGANDPVDMLGATRGVYLEGFGAVFTAEVSLILTPTVSPFRQTITKEMAAQVHQRKLERLPALRAAMRDMMRAAAMTLIQIPDKEIVVVAVRLDYLSWEDTAGLPGQILMRADRKSAMAGEFKEEAQ